MNYTKAFHKLTSIKQTQLLVHWSTLNHLQQQHLLSQIQQLDCSVFEQQQYVLKEPDTVSHQEIEPFTSFSYAGNCDDFNRGKALVADKKVGCLIIAGGQGSRLHFEGPKGKFPVSLIKKKSLFQLFAEKIVAAGNQVNSLIDVAIMTSPLNHIETVNFFEENNLFGLKRNQLSFFLQETLPFLNEQGNLFLEAKDTIATGPDGNGGALQQFYKSGLWEQWYTKGIRYLNFILIDNPLADPVDAELLGFHERNESDIVIKCAKRIHQEEKVGLLAKNHGNPIIIEYSEMPEAMRTAKNSDGTFQYLCANLSLFSFSMDFIRSTLLDNSSSMPLHKAFKKVKYLNENGETISPESPIAWKFEKFIFDILPKAKKVDALLYPREECFAPLKNFSGDHSLKTVQEALQNRDRKILSELMGRPCSLEPFELAQDFYYPTAELRKKWSQMIPLIQAGGYLEP